MVEELEKALEFAPRDVREADSSLISFAGAVDHGSLEEILEIRRVALEEVAMYAEKRVLHLYPR